MTVIVHVPVTSIASGQVFLTGVPNIAASVPTMLNVLAVNVPGPAFLRTISLEAVLPHAVGPNVIGSLSVTVTVGPGTGFCKIVLADAIA